MIQARRLLGSARYRSGRAIASLHMASGRYLASQKLRRQVPRGALLHLGCGHRRLPGWINLDGDRSVGPDVRHDLRFGLPLPAGSLRYIYSEHVLEHLDLGAARALLADLRRALAPSGILRVAMPALRALVDAYLGNWRDQAWLQEEGYNYIDTPARMLNVALRHWGHQYVYDEAELHHRLREAGFARVTPRDCGQSPHPPLQGLESRPDSKLILEASAS